MKLFVIRDLARKDYHGNPFFAENENVAKRSWIAFCKSLASQPHVDVADFQLVELSYGEISEVTYEEI